MTFSIQSKESFLLIRIKFIKKTLDYLKAID